MLSKMIKSVLKHTLVMISVILLGFLLIVGVYCLPTGRMWGNVNASVSTFENEGIYYNLLNETYSRLDNFSDAIMIGNVISSDGKGILDDAMSNYHLKIPNGNNITALKAYVNHEETSQHSYGRYWHGYLTVLKPLFMFFNYSQIRMINITMQIIVIGVLVILLTKKNKAFLGIPVILSWMVFCPLSLGMSLMFSSVFYITYITAIVIVIMNKKNRDIQYTYLFLIVGATTSYMDLLSFPLLTLIIPLSLLLILEQDDSKNYIHPLKKMLFSGLAWGIGYLVMWVSKWIIASAITGTDFIADSMNQIAFRTSTTNGNGNHVSIINGVERSWSVLKEKPMYVVGLIAVVFSAATVFINRRRLDISFLHMYPQILLSLVPIVWMMITCNHSTIHYWFTYRNFAAVFFALDCGLLSIIRSTSKGIENKELLCNT